MAHQIEIARAREVSRDHLAAIHVARHVTEIAGASLTSLYLFQISRAHGYRCFAFSDELQFRCFNYSTLIIPLRDRAIVFISFCNLCEVNDVALHRDCSAILCSKESPFPMRIYSYLTDHSFDSRMPRII